MRKIINFLITFSLTLCLPCLSRADIICTVITGFPSAVVGGTIYPLEFNCVNQAQPINNVYFTDDTQGTGRFMDTTSNCPSSLNSGESCHYSGIYLPVPGVNNLKIIVHTSEQDFPQTNIGAIAAAPTGPTQLMISSNSSQNITAYTKQSATGIINIVNPGGQALLNMSISTTPAGVLTPISDSTCGTYLNPGNNCSYQFQYTAPTTDSGNRAAVTPVKITLNGIAADNSAMRASMTMRAIHADTGAFLKAPEELSAMRGMIGNFTAMAIGSPYGVETLYAATNANGIYRSTDEGGTWLPMNESLPASALSSVKALATSANGTVYVGTASGIFKRGVNATDWSALPDLPAEATNVTALTVDNQNFLYAGTANGKVYQFNGTAWVSFGSNLPDSSVTALAFNPNKAMLYAAVSGTVTNVYSITGGSQEQWIAAGTALPATAINALVFDKAYDLFIATDIGVYTLAANAPVSTAWQQVGSALNQTTILSLAIDNQNILYAGSANSIYRIVRGAGDWTQFNTGLVPKPITYLLADKENNIYAATNNAILYKLLNGNSVWYSINAWINGKGTYSITTDTIGNVYIGAADNPTYSQIGGVYKVSFVNGGAKLLYLGKGLDTSTVSAIITDQHNNLYAAAISPVPAASASVYSYSPATNQWDLLGTGFPTADNSSISTLAIDNQNNLYAAYFTYSPADSVDGVYKLSLNSVGAWSLFGGQGPNELYNALTIDKNNNFYLGGIWNGTDPALYTIPNGTGNWSPLVIQQDSKANILGLAADNNGVLYVLADASNPGGTNIYRYDAGAWTRVFTSTFISTTLARNITGNTIYLGLISSLEQPPAGIYELTEPSKQFVPLSNKPLMDVQSLATDNQNTLYVVTMGNDASYYGIYQLPNSQNTIKK